LYAALGNSLQLEETFTTLDCELRRIVPCEAISVDLAKGGVLETAWSAGAGAGEWRARAEGGFNAAALERRPCVNMRLEGGGARAAALAVPLEYGGRVTGLLAVYRDAGRPFSPDDADVLLMLAPKLAAAVENARAHGRLQELAGIDPATGRHTARALFQYLDAELSRAGRYAGQVAVLHCAAGAAGGGSLPPQLRDRIGAALREDGREYDFCGSSGNDWVLVLPGFRRSDLASKRTRLTGILERLGRGTGVALRMRTGAAFFPEDGADAEDLLAAAAGRLAREGAEAADDVR
jgi:hypothetical protein